MAEINSSPKDALRNILVRDYVLSFLTLFGFIVAFHALTPTLPIYLQQHEGWYCVPRIRGDEPDMTDNEKELLEVWYEYFGT